MKTCEVLGQDCQEMEFRLELTGKESRESGGWVGAGALHGQGNGARRAEGFLRDQSYKGHRCTPGACEFSPRMGEQQ